MYQPLPGFPLPDGRGFELGATRQRAWTGAVFVDVRIGDVRSPGWLREHVDHVRDVLGALAFGRMRLGREAADLLQHELDAVLETVEMAPPERQPTEDLARWAAALAARRVDLVVELVTAIWRSNPAPPLRSAIDIAVGLATAPRAETPLLTTAAHHALRAPFDHVRLSRAQPLRPDPRIGASGFVRSLFFGLGVLDVGKRAQQARAELEGGVELLVGFATDRGALRGRIEHCTVVVPPRRYRVASDSLEVAALMAEIAGELARSNGSGLGGSVLPAVARSADDDARARRLRELLERLVATRLSRSD